MQVLDITSVKAQLTMSAAINAIENLLITQDKHPDWVICPERLVIPTFSRSARTAASSPARGSHLTMPSVVFDGQDEFAVVKLVTICPDNPQRNLPTTTAVITVSDNATGEILAMMDGVYVTQVRTAALSGIATKYMANPESRCVAVIGCGGMAFEQLNAVLTVCPSIQKVVLWNKTGQKAHSFAQQFCKDYPQWSVDIEVEESIEMAVKEADIINLATRSTQGLIGIEQIKPDVHINAVGAYQPEMKEVSNEVVAACAAVVIDDLAGGRHEAGDLIQAHDASDCQWRWDHLTGELIDLVTNTVTVDKGNKGMTLFKSVGAASFDAAVALEVAKAAKVGQLGQTVCW